jgi:hypothetical protein
MERGFLRKRFKLKSLSKKLRCPADPQSKAITRDMELRNSLIKDISQHHKEVNFILASVMNYRPRRPKQRFLAASANAVRTAGSRAPQTTRFGGRQGFKGPPSEGLVEPEARRSPRGGTLGPAVQRRLPILYKRSSAPKKERFLAHRPLPGSPSSLTGRTRASQPRTRPRTRKPMSLAPPAARQFTGNTARAPRALGQSSHG